MSQSDFLEFITDDLPDDGNPADIVVPHPACHGLIVNLSPLIRIRQMVDRVEVSISRLSVRDNFWNSVCLAGSGCYRLFSVAFG